VNENQRAILKNMTLLYVEDHEKTTAEAQKIFLKLFKKVLVASNGKEALDIYENNHIDMIITDIDMPQMDGITLIEKIRETNNKISVIILTAYADRDLLLKATNLQIDGYLIKPMNLDKVISALTNALKRVDVYPTFKIQDTIEYDLHNKQLFHNNEAITLGAKENQFLYYLIKNQNKIITKEELMDSVWTHEYPSDSAFKNIIYSLRKKIGKDVIENVAGVGWRISLTSKL